MAQIITITNPLTGQPAQVDQLDHTAQQIDDGLNIARGVSNPNLLDNWYFGNPIDQRQGRVVKPNTTYYSDNTLATAAGTTSAYVTAYRYATGTASGVNYASFKLTDSNTAPTYYAAPENVVRGYAAGMGVPTYIVDRWNIEAFCSAVIESDGLIVNFYNAGYNLSQPVDASVFNAIKGRTVTLSAIVDGVLSSAMVVMPNATPAERTELLLEYRGNLRFRIVLNPTGVIEVIFSSIGVQTNKFKSVKLELGTQQTIAHQDANGNWVLNEIPDYGEQLARCQRYFQTFETESLRHTDALDFRPVMRTNPALSTITVGGKTLYAASADL